MSIKKFTQYTYEHYERSHDAEHSFPAPFNTEGDPEEVYISENGLHAVIGFLVQDSEASTPREWDNLGTMFCSHRNYTLGDENADDIRDDEGNYPNNYIVLPLYLYDHSGITMKTSPFSCQWDSGQVGYIYVSKERIKQEYNCKIVTAKIRQRVIECMVQEVKTYDDYLTGSVYGVVVWDYHRASIADEWEEPEREECWGYYGYDGYTKEELKSQFNYAAYKNDPAKENTK